MKNTTFFCIFFLCVANAWSQNYYLATPQGYAASVTGGGNATPVTVTTYTALRNALISTTAANAVILVSGTIDCTYMSITLNNKTIIGLPGARLRNTQITVGNSTTSASNSGILNIKSGSNNVIVRNLIFEGPGAYDVDGRDNITNEGTNVWIDHCEFQDGIDGNLDNKGTADNVTISWCKFTYLKPAIAGGSGGSNDHRFSNLVGSSSTDAPADGNYSITFQNCYWASGCKERMPRARNAQLHILSCYYNVGVTSSKALGLGGGVNNTTCYVENSHFTTGTAVYTSYISTDGGTVGLSFNNCINGVANVGTTVAAPTYITTPIPANQVAAFLTDANCGAGGTLQVASDGTITPSNCALAQTDFSDAVVNFFPTLIDDTLKLHFSNTISGNTNITIYSMNGQKVFSFSKDIAADEIVELNLEALQKGTYVGSIEINNTTKNWKFIKN